MQILSAKEAKYGFGRLIDLGRADPVAKHGRPVVVVLGWRNTSGLRRWRASVPEKRQE